MSSDDERKNDNEINKSGEIVVPIATPISSAKFSKTTGIIALGANISSSIALVTANKWLFMVTPFKGFVTTLSFFHFIVTCLVLHLMLYFGFFTHKKLPLWEIVKMSSVCSFGIVFMNLNLKSNSLGVYQLSKLLLIPTIAILQYKMYNTTLSMKVMSSLAVMILGVGLATIDSLRTNSAGTFWALLSIVTQSMCQIFISSKQKELDADPNQLIFYQMHLNTLFIIPALPFLDNYDPSSSESIWNITWNFPTVNALLLTCVLAAILNISGFFVVGIFSPITYSVAGHSKTIAVLLAGFLLFGDLINIKISIGCLLAIFGMVAYGYLK